MSPHELVQEVTVASKRRFLIGKQSEGVEFLSWLLNSLHLGVGGSRKPGSSVIHQAFQGKVTVTSFQRKTAAIRKKEAELNKAAEGDDGKEEDDTAKDEEAMLQEGWEKEEAESPFLLLSLDIPPTPLFKDSQGGNIIPQVPLFDVLDKYNGSKFTDVLKAGYQQRKRYGITKLPQFIIFHLQRFTKNNFYMEKNHTIVTFPVKNLELKDYMHFTDSIGVPTNEELQGMSISHLKDILRSQGLGWEGCVEKADLVEKVRSDVMSQLVTKYDLLANICHDSPPGQKKDSGMTPLEAGSYRVHVQNKATEQWYEIQDLHVQETMPQLVGLSESYMLIYERQKSAREAAADSAAALQSELYS